MARVCEYCERRTSVGGQKTRRGIPKYKGGIGVKLTSHTKRTFKPNIQKVRALIHGSVTRVNVCARCIKAGRVIKPS